MKEIKIKTLEDMCEVSPVCFKEHYDYLLKVPDAYHYGDIAFETLVEAVTEEQIMLLTVLNVYHYDFQKIDKSTHKKLYDEICSLASKLLHDWINEWRERRFSR